jgi:hypothetical protein
MAGAAAANAAPAAAKPGVVLTFASATVRTGVKPQVTFVGTKLPSGTVLYLQRGTAQGSDWQNVARSAGASGTADIPADQPGTYDYRMVAVNGRQDVAISADAQLTVTGAPDSCAVCRIAHDTTPWLKSIGTAVSGWVVGKALDWIWGVLTDW